MGAIFRRVASDFIFVFPAPYTHTCRHIS